MGDTWTWGDAEKVYKKYENTAMTHHWEVTEKDGEEFVELIAAATTVASLESKIEQLREIEAAARAYERDDRVLLKRLRDALAKEQER